MAPRQETLKQIINILPATGWRAVFVDDIDAVTIKPTIQPCAYFAAVRAITLKPGCRYRHDRASDEQNIEDVQEYVELHVGAEGEFGFEDPEELNWFYRYLAPGQDWNEGEQKKMEAHFAERKKAQESNGGEEAD